MEDAPAGSPLISSAGIAGKRVIVTGAATGIGRATAIGFAQNGAHVLVNHWKDEPGGQQTIALAKGAASAAGQESQLVLAEADIGSETGPGELFDAALDQLGGVDIVINNAAIKSPHRPADYPVADFDRVMQVNLRGPFLMAQRAIRHFQQHHIPGTILCVSSVHDAIPLPSDVVYTMSKGGLLMMVKTLAKAVEGTGIRVHAVSPGAVDTPMNANWDRTSPARQGFEASVPLRRAGEAEEIAAALLFLASDAAAYMTGQTIYVDGGLML